MGLRTVTIGAVALVRYLEVEDGTFSMIGLDLGDRGCSLPGGKVEPGETFREAAVRELREETGLVATSAELLFHGASDNGTYAYTFLCQVPKDELLLAVGVATQEGCVDLLGWNDLLARSPYRGYYEVLREHMRQRGFKE